MQLFYAPDITIPEYTLSEEESRHCEKVLRLGTGDTLNLTDGRGNLYTARITSKGKHCTVRITDTQREFERRPYSFTIAVAPTKNIDRYEWFAEKATETGIDRLVPIECEHSERRIIKIERLEKIVISAIKQSLKAYTPQIDQMTPLRKLIAEPFDGQRFIAHCDSTRHRVLLRDALVPHSKAMLLIGPEGDFSTAEIEQAVAAGFTEVSLGSMRLRTETAALAGVMTASIINL